MLSITLGPVALPVAPLLLAASVWAGAAIAARLGGRGAVAAGAPGAPHTPDAGLGTKAGDAVFHASLIGLAVARLVHLVLHAGAYAASPWSLLDLRDGGWNASSGSAAALAWMAVRGWRTAGLRRPLAAAALATIAIWTLGSFATGRYGRPALPDVAVVDLATGRRTSLAQAAAGRPVVLNLWASWCGPCREEMPALARAQRRDPGIAFLFVNQGEAPEAVRAYLQREGLPLREVLLDADAALGPAVGSRGLPTTLFHDARGRRTDAHFGVLSEAGLESRLRRLRATP
jgi:thiol-disulfide isomerase/thioredoxin